MSDDLKKYSNYISAIVLLTFAILVYWYVHENWHLFKNIALINPYAIIGVLLLILFNIYAVGMTLEIAVEPHGVELTQNEIFGLAMVSRFANHTLPAGIGASLRAFYLKKNHGVSYTEFASSISVSVALQFVVTGSMALLIYYWYVSTISDSDGLLMLLGLCVVAVIFLFPVNWIIKYIPASKNKFYQKIYDLGKLYATIRSSPQVFLRSAFWILVSVFSAALSIYLLYYSLDYSVEIYKVIFISSMGVWGMLVSLTPGNIGIREGLMTVGAGLMGVSIPETLIVALVFRLLTFLTAIGFSAYFIPLLFGISMFQIKSLIGKK